MVQHTTNADAEEIPGWNVEVNDDDGLPVGWRNTNRGTFIGIIENQRHEGWVVTGENSTIRTADTKEEARDAAQEYMLDTREPSAMM